MPWITLNHRTHKCPIPVLHRESVGDEWACPHCGCVWRVRPARQGLTEPRWTDPGLALERTNDRQLSS